MEKIVTDIVEVDEEYKDLIIVAHIEKAQPNVANVVHGGSRAREGKRAYDDVFT
jgi:hypothetical protein